MQCKIEAEIKDHKNSDAPMLVLISEWWIKFVTDLGQQAWPQLLDAPALVLISEWWTKFAAAPGEPESPSENNIKFVQPFNLDHSLRHERLPIDGWTNLNKFLVTPSHPPGNISIHHFLGGGVTKSQPVAPGQEVRLLPLALDNFAAKPLAYQSVEGPLKIEQLATGRNSEHEFYDYLRVKPLDGESYWVPAQWVESPSGLSVRRDPDAYAPRIPSATLRTWRNWLWNARSPLELEKFERHRQPSELKAVVDSLDSQQVATLLSRFRDWGIKRDWLSAVDDDEPVTAAQAAGPSATGAAASSPPKEVAQPLATGAATASPPSPAPSPAIPSPPTEAPVKPVVTPASSGNANIPNDKHGGWLPAEVCIFGQWSAGFWRHIVTGEWRSPLGTVPLVTQKEWRLA